MIAVKIEPTGIVKVAAKGHRDVEAARKVLYLTKRNPTPTTLVAWCWWTYLPDLRRDLAGRLAFTPGSKEALARVLGDLAGSQVGDDAFVHGLFADGTRPHDYQTGGIHFGLKVERGLLADDVGLGKTIQALGILLAGIARGTIRRGLIICPSAVKHQWYEEVMKFARTAPDPMVVIARGEPARRAAIWRGAWQAAIVNPELVLRDRAVIERVSSTIDYVALDEASMIRNPESQIAECLKALFSHTRYRLALTATPVENKLADLRSVFEFVDRRVFPSREYFNLRYVVWAKMKFFVRKKNGQKVRITKFEPKSYKNLIEVQAKIRPCYLRRRACDVGHELPELIVRWEVVDLPKRQREVYDSCKADVEEKIAGLRSSALYAPLQSLRQACNSTALVLEGGKEVSAKLERFRELLDTDLAGEQVIAFTEYERWVRLLARSLAAFRPATFTGGAEDLKTRNTELAAFQSGHRRLLLATKAAERGLNLQNAAVVVNLDLPFNPAALKQRIGRARRLKSEHKTVRVINMVAENTIEDSLIRKAIYAKRGTFEGVFGDDELTDADPIRGMTGHSLKRYL